MAVKDFKGSNDLGARDLFNYRSVYEGYALNPNGYTPVMSKVGVRDFNKYSNIFYGKYPFSSTEVLKPKSELLVTRGDYYMFDFVALALDDMLANFERARTQQVIKTDERYLSRPEVQAGYIDLDSLYTQRFLMYSQKFISYLEALNMKQEIISFEDYAEAFKQYVIRSANRVPLTRSQFILSRSVPILSTGLSFGISGLNASLDQPKIDLFYKSPNFEFYRNSAVAYGFLINKNAPWILTADLGSPQMRKYLEQSAASSFLLNGNFSSAYDEVSISDVEYLKTQIIDFYADFVTRNPYYRVTEQGAYGEESCSRLVRRDTTAGNADSVLELREKYGDDYWLPFYGELRFAESGLQADEATKNFVINNAVQISEQKDSTEAVRYIQRKTFNIVAVEGSLMYQTKKLDAKNLTDASNSDILKEVQREVINDKFELF
tara:strand:+ start:102 stop:1406 length:1305 start_codon:yes stop_codon:yes gene_type:complete